MKFPETFSPLLHMNTTEKIQIISNNQFYPINKSLAAAISPYFFQALLSNPMLKEIFLPINENIEGFFRGKSIDRDLFLSMSIILDNKEFLTKWKKENEINKGNAIDHLMKFIKYKGKLEDMVEEIEFIGKNFEELEDQIKIKNLPSIYLGEIIKKAKGVKSESKIYNYVIEKLKNEKEKINRKKLIESIEIRGLQDQNIKELIKNLKYEELSELLILRIKENIIYTKMKAEKKKMKIELNARKCSNTENLIKENKKEIQNEHLPVLKGKESQKGIQKQIQKEFPPDQKEILLKKSKKEPGQADNNNYNPNGFSPLHYAAENNSKEKGEKLISEGADINAKAIKCNNIEIF